MRTSSLILFSSATLLLTVVGCGGDDSKGGSSGSTGGATSGGSGGGFGTGGAGTGGSATGGGSSTGGSSGGGDETYFETATSGVGVGVGAYNYFDPGGSTAVLTNPESGKLCLKGTTSGHGDSAYDTNWGAGLGYALVEEAEKLAGSGCDVSAGTAIEFTLEGSAIPSELRVGFLQSDDQENSFFSSAVSEGANSLSFESLAQGDWVTAPVAKDFSSVTDLQFQAASGSSDEAYEFCVSNLTIVGASCGDGMGAGGGTSVD